MAWQDRSYYRDRGSSPTNPLMWLLTGSVPLFTVFGIRVRAHASLLLYAALVLIFGFGQGYTWQSRVQNVTVLFVIVLLHEFGHCFTARWVGGSADDILMHPLGGLAMTSPPHRPWPTFLTVAGGPAVNVLICLISGLILWVTTGWLPWNPFRFSLPAHHYFNSWFQPWWYVYWIYSISYMLLVFNLIPIFPLDGGQMVQTMLWPKMGYYRSMLASLTVGLVAAVLAVMVGIAGREPNLVLLGGFGFLMCFMRRRELVAVGPEEWADETDYSAAYEQPNSYSSKSTTRKKKINRRALKKARKLAMDAQLEQKRVDQILAKVSATGMASLTWSERRALHKATEQQRKRDVSSLS